MKYTNEELINLIKKLGVELGRTPSQSDMRKAKGYPSPTTFRNYFRTWNNALKAAGFETCKDNIFKNNCLITKEKLINDIHRFVKENGRIPFSKDMKSKDGYHNFGTYKKYFGSWNKALIEAGYKPINTKPINRVCSICNSKNSKKWSYDEKRDIYCYSCFLKQKRKFRNGKLYYKSKVGKGITGELIVQKTLTISKENNLNLFKDLKQPYDLKHKIYGKIDAKFVSKKFNGTNNKWHIGLSTQKQKQIIHKCDNFIILGKSEDERTIEHVWIIPSDDEIVKNKKSLTIYETNKHIEKFKQFEVDQTQYNEVYQNMSIENCEYLTKK